MAKKKEGTILALYRDIPQGKRAKFVTYMMAHAFVKNGPCRMQRYYIGLDQKEIDKMITELRAIIGQGRVEFIDLPLSVLETVKST